MSEEQVWGYPETHYVQIERVFDEFKSNNNRAIICYASIERFRFIAEFILRQINKTKKCLLLTSEKSREVLHVELKNVRCEYCAFDYYGQHSLTSDVILASFDDSGKWVNDSVVSDVDCVILNIDTNMAFDKKMLEAFRGFKCCFVAVVNDREMVTNFNLDRFFGIIQNIAGLSI